MSIYIYHGSMSADTINKIDYIFFDGAEYTLPENNNKIKTMLRQGVLTLKTGVETAKNAVPARTRKGTQEEKGTREQRAKDTHGGVEPAEKSVDPFNANEEKGTKK